ncbi:MAG: glycoside hydrolase family 3 N-terminal domain-containing protein [Bacteroides sp.]
MRKFVLLTLLVLVAAFSTAAGQTGGVEPLLLYKAQQDKRCTQWVDSLMRRMTRKEKVGQLFIYTIAPVDYKRNLVLLREAIQTYKIGGLLFSGGKLHNQAQVTNLAQKQARIPLMITFDGEWGLSMRLRGTPVFPHNRVLGCIQDDRLLYEYGREMARECHEMGVQVNFAPVADVNINPRNPVINTRSFGENPVKVAEKVIAYGSGLEGGGVLSVCKHFPGHGDTNVDSHKALPVLPFTRERLDSVELYPFKEAIRAGLGGMMVGHLQVPIIDPVGGLPSSLSRNVVYGLLTEELAFKGLIFTDALAMRGVSGNGSLSLQALKAGNDLVLSPHNLKAEMAAVYQALDRGELREEDIDSKCRKVLTFKYLLGLRRKPVVRLSGLGNRINTPQTRDLIRRLNVAAITVASNRKKMLPLHPQQLDLALLEVGAAGAVDPFAGRLARYACPVRFQLTERMTEAQTRILCDSLAQYKRLIVAVGESRLSAYQPFFARLAEREKGLPTVFVFFTPGKRMLQVQRAVAAAGAVVLAHTLAEEVQTHVADLLFAHATADGRLSASIGTLFREGEGVTLSPDSPLHFLPEEYGLRPEKLALIDSIALEGIREGAYPGCQVVVMKDGHEMVNRCFGTFCGSGSTHVRPTDSYDLASLTKTSATLLAVMKLYDKGRFNLTDKLSDYLPFLLRTNKKAITVSDVLFHQSGLPAGIPLYSQAMKKGGLSEMTDAERAKALVKAIAKAKMGKRSYCYSDVGFVLLRLLVERLADQPMEGYLEREFYGPMGLERTAFLPLRRYGRESVVPSTVDRVLHRDTLQGEVHDETAAFQGGVSGNAGLFSTASEVARIYQLLLNGGELDGQRYLSEETCRLFTTAVTPLSRRALGFDRPDTAHPDRSPCAPDAPPSVYGHTGYTGTCAWVDPEQGTVVVFLSNRTFPSAENRKLQQLRIRERIQQAVYEAMK